MNINNWLKLSTKRLEHTNIGTARLDCLVLLEDVLGKDRSTILAHDDTTLSDKQLMTLRSQIQRRTTHEPLAYIRGKTEFYGREFIVNDSVLEPRSESETIIDLLKALHSPDTTCITDLGCGSGALGITAKLELPKAKVYAIDIDPNCLAVAKQNAQKHAAEIHFLKGNLLQPLMSHDSCLMTHVLLANLPYVPTNHPVNQAANHEPTLALYGGTDGLDLYRQMFSQIATMITKPSAIITESLPSQHKALSKIAKQSGYKQSTKKDYIQTFTKT